MRVTLLTLRQILERVKKETCSPSRCHCAGASALNEFARQKPPRSEPDNSIGKGFYWDEAILYSLGAYRRGTLASIFWSGPVYRISSGPGEGVEPVD